MLATDVRKRESPVLYADRTGCQNCFTFKLPLIISGNVPACGGFFLICFLFKIRVSVLIVS
jgi:hypothetical protein